MYPKWVVRKRFWGPRKQIIYTTSDEVGEPVDASTRKLRRRQAEEQPNRASATTDTPANSNGYFDDVFKVQTTYLHKLEIIRIIGLFGKFVAKFVNNLHAVFRYLHLLGYEYSEAVGRGMSREVCVHLYSFTLVYFALLVITFA